MSRYLLDTHVALWWWTDFSRLGRAARTLLESGIRKFHIGVASVWDIAIKTRSGTPTAIADFPGEYKPLMVRNGFEPLAMTDEHALRAGSLAVPHRDPFDRLIAAQALIEDLTVITRDRKIADFGCKVLW